MARFCRYCGKSVSENADFCGTEGAAVLSPVSGVLRCLGIFFGGMLGLFQKPWALLLAAALAALWTVLPGLRDSDSKLVGVLSWLTFADGGYGRELPGMLGGVRNRSDVKNTIFTINRKSASLGQRVR